MKLINAEELIKYFEKKRKIYENTYDILNMQDIDAIISVIDNQPAVNASPCDESKWVKTTQSGFYSTPRLWYKCEKCGVEADAIPDDETQPNFSDYCPNCGRKMKF